MTGFYNEPMRALPAPLCLPLRLFFCVPFRPPACSTHAQRCRQSRCGTHWINARALSPALLAAALLFTAVPLFPQQGNPPLLPPHQNAGSPTLFPGDNDPMARTLARKQLERQDADRQKQLVADTGKLLALAQQLKQEVDKSDRNTLSLTVIKKAEEIEKLARSVKDKMRAAY